MNNIHLHLHSRPGLLKGNIDNTEKHVDVLADHTSIETHEKLNHKYVVKIPSGSVNRLNELTERSTMQKLDSIINNMTGFSCIAEYNYYRRCGG